MYARKVFYPCLSDVHVVCWTTKFRNPKFEDHRGTHTRTRLAVRVDLTSPSTDTSLHPLCAMSYDPISSPSPYRPYVVPLDPSPSILNSSKSSPRDLLADLDIPTDYLETPEFSDMLTNLITKGLSRYASVFIRQPFEIVKTTMQVQYLGRPGPTIFPPPRPSRSESEEEYDDVTPYLVIWEIDCVGCF